MPCYMTGSAEGDARLEAADARREATKLTRLLCEVCVYLEGRGYADLPPALAKWWEQHQAVDRKRREQEEATRNAEKLKKSAKAKLSPAERKALGI